MSVEQNKELARRWIEGYRGDLSVVDEVVAPDAIRFFNGIKRSQTDWSNENEKKFIRDIRAAWPDCEITVDRIVAEGDTVAMALTFRGTHTEAWGERAATNKKGRW